jgi:hypothetical protein
MKSLFTLILVLAITACGSGNNQSTVSSVASQTTEPVFFELRTYYCNPGKLDDLLTRFNDNTMKLFEKHGMVNMAYWLPMDNQDNKLVYLLGYQSHEQRDKAWSDFSNDPEWKRVSEASQVNGAIVDSVASWFLTYTDYSPRLKPEDLSSRIFSHRTYYTNEGKLEDLNSRFRDHTIEIFENNGMTNIAYFNLESSQPEAKNVLTYFISFPDTAARTASWKSFLEDATWKSVYEASIINGKLVDSITDDILVPTAFSPLK